MPAMRSGCPRESIRRWRSITSASSPTPSSGSNKLEYTTVGFQLLPGKFTLSQLQRVYEAVLGRQLDKRNFRRKMALLDTLKPLKEWVRDGPSRPAQLYRASARPTEQPAAKHPRRPRR